MMRESTSDRQSASASRSSLRLAIFFGVVGATVLALDWPGERIAFGIAGFFLVVSLIESLGPKLRRQRPSENVVPMTLPSSGEFAQYLLRGERAFGTTILLSGRIALLDLCEDEQIEDRKRFAHYLIGHTVELSSNFEAFKRAEAARNTRYAESILGLQIEWISFCDSDPQSGEVYFTRESGEDMWFCGLQGLTFDSLTMES